MACFLFFVQHPAEIKLLKVDEAYEPEEAGRKRAQWQEQIRKQQRNFSLIVSVDEEIFPNDQPFS